MKRITSAITSILIFCAVAFASAPAYAAVIDESPSAQEETAESIQEQGSDLPSSYSSRDLGYCTSVKSQIGSICWAYASISSFETLQLKNHFFTTDLSITELDKWGTTEENGDGWQRSEREPGYTYIPIGYFTSWGGPVTTEEGAAAKYGVTKLRYLSPNRRDEIKKAIMDDGAVTANINLYTRGYSSDRCSFCLTDEISSIYGHTMSVVGWDDNYPKEKFDGNYNPKGDGAWLCKNSWGDNNDIGGYLWVSYEDHYLFNEDRQATSFAIEKVRTIEENDSIYQNEIYGATFSFSTDDEEEVTDFFNVFDFSQKGNVLDNVVFETRSAGADYRIYYVPLNENGVPVSEKNRWKQISGGTVEYQGYIEADVDNYVVPKKPAAICVEIDTTENNSNPENDRIQCNIGTSEWLRQTSTGKMQFIKPCEQGKSFVSTKEGIMDLKDYYSEKLDDDIGGTLVIKAITNGTRDTGLLGDADLNGVVNINDATYIQKHISGEYMNLNDDQLLNSDFNCDGVININDVTAIQKSIAGSEEE